MKQENIQRGNSKVRKQGDIQEGNRRVFNEEKG